MPKGRLIQRGRAKCAVLCRFRQVGRLLLLSLYHTRAYLSTHVGKKWKHAQTAWRIFVECGVKKGGDVSFPMCQPFRRTVGAPPPASTGEAKSECEQGYKTLDFNVFIVRIALNMPSRASPVQGEVASGARRKGCSVGKCYSPYEKLL